MACGNTKISNQNALLSLLSQEDFTDLKKQIHTKIGDGPQPSCTTTKDCPETVTSGAEQNDELIFLERNEENTSKS